MVRAPPAHLGRSAAPGPHHGRTRLDHLPRPRSPGHSHRGHRLLRRADPRERPPGRPPSSIPAAPAGRWSVQHLPVPVGGPGRRVIHHESCWIPTGGADLTLDQALRELARPGSEACAACDARHLSRS
ncbi:DUF6233 domain-containing protein [Streptomyces sp. 6N106]|uniref:DUF6233 domain-containing protein n=1 Tax=Streptomyces sp. 6N106 TaxID=3457418 RepID=UPI003FD23765